MFNGPLNRPKGKQLENKIHLFENLSAQSNQAAKKHKVLQLR